MNIDYLPTQARDKHIEHFKEERCVCVCVCVCFVYVCAGVADPRSAHSGCVSDPLEGFWCFQIPLDIAMEPVNQIRLVLPSGQEQEFFVTMDHDGVLTQVCRETQRKGLFPCLEMNTEKNDQLPRQAGTIVRNVEHKGRCAHRCRNRGRTASCVCRCLSTQRSLRPLACWSAAIQHRSAMAVSSRVRMGRSKP